MTREPVVCESSNNSFGVILIANLWVCGVWQPQVYVLLRFVLLTLMPLRIAVAHHRLFCIQQRSKETKVCRGLFGSSCILYTIMVFN